MSGNNNLSELDGGPLDSHPSLYTHLEQGLRRSPNEPAIIVMHQPPNHLSDLASGFHPHEADCLIWTYEQLHNSALKVAAGLLADGVKLGDTFMTFIPNSIEWALIVWTCAILKLPLACLDPGALSTARTAELQNYLSTLNPRVVVAHSPEGAAAIDRAIHESGARGPCMKVCFDTASSLSEGWSSFMDIASAGDRKPFDINAVLESARHDNPNRTAFMLFTSGTSSGQPKGCPRHVAGVTSSVDMHPWDTGDIRGQPVRFLLPTPNFRVIAPSFSMSIWTTGGTVVMGNPAPTGGFSPAGALDAIEQHGVTLVLLIPVFLYMLIEHPSFASRKLDSLGAVMIGADIITRDLLAKTQSSFPSARVSVGHGMTETSGVLRWPFHGTPIDKLPCFGDICPIGIPSPGLRVLIKDVNSGAVTRRGDPGELCFCAEAVIKQYLHNTNADSFFVDESGRRWFRTGDLAIIDKDGVVFILGRLKDVIMRAGLSITAAALESCISKFVGCTTSVVGIPHATLGQEPFAIVQGWHGKTEEEIKAHVLDMFGKDYALAGVSSLKELQMDGFPYNGTGKILKFELEKMVSQLYSHSR